MGRDCCPDRHLTSYNNRAKNLKLLLCAIALVLGVGIVQGQPVPDTILLPDSLGPLRPGYHLAFGSSTDNIYVASESSDIIVVDGNTFQRIKRINTGTPVGSVLLVAQHNKLYCTYPSRGRIGIIDCATNDTVGSILVSARPGVLSYSSGTNKLYCCDSVNRKLWVIDCVADTARKVISTASSPVDIVYDPATNKAYVATREAVLAISCVTDSVVASIDRIKSSRGLCFNKRRQKLYVPGSRYANPETIYVVSTQTYSVTPMITATSGVIPLLACNEATDRLYYSAYSYEDVRVYDCVGDTYVGYGLTPGYEAEAIACDTLHNRLFHLSECELSIYDCVTFDAVARHGVGMSDPYPALELDPARYRVMSANWSYPNGVGALSVFDYKHDTTYERGSVPLCGWSGKMCHNPATGRLYCSLGGCVSAVVDEQTNRVVKWARGVGGNLVHSRTSNKFCFPAEYGPFGEQGGLGVMDGTTDSLIGVVGLGDSRWQPFPCWCPIGNKVYCFASKDARWFIAVVDCSTDSVVWERDIYGLGRWFEYLDNGLMLCNHSDGLALIDPRTDSVLVDSSLAAGAVYAVTHTGDGEKVYLARFGRLEVRSADSLTLLSTIDWPYFGSAMGTSLAYSDTARKLYWFVRDSVLAIDATSDTVTTRMATSALYSGACLDHTGRYLFCTSYDTLSVYDVRSDSLVAVYPQLLFPPLRIMSNPDLGCIYLARQDVILVYPDTPPGVEETPSAEVQTTNPGPTVLRGNLHLPLESGVERRASSVLLDVSGRKVMDLHTGANDIRPLAPGVYFVREEPQASSFKPQAVRKIVVTR
jgi:DNA-binding beta-propeller fold protein YncE